MEGDLDEIYAEPPSLVADDDRKESPFPPHPPTPERDEDNVRASSRRDSEVLASFHGTRAPVLDGFEVQRLAKTVVHITAYQHLRPSLPCEN